MDKIELNKCQKDKIAEICAEFHNSPGEPRSAPSSTTLPVS